MVKTIVIWVFVAAVLIFIAVWALTGGVGRAIQTGRNMLSPAGLFTGNASGTSFTLPWQTPIQPADVDTGESYFDSSLSSDTQSNDLNDAQGDYSQSDTATDRVKQFGNPSPYSGKVVFVSNTASESDPQQEYLQVQNASSDTISLSGWSIQSVYSGGRLALPNAASPLITGAVNALSPVTLVPGAFADIISGISPVGVSFSENVCTGYLAQFQTFAPPLNDNCPASDAALPVTEQNLRTFGDTCIDFVRSLASCHFPTGSEIPSSVTPQCRAFVGNNFSYNGCVSAHRGDTDFQSEVWRLYLGTRGELWRNTHDVVRLLDSTGRTVDVLTY